MAEIAIAAEVSTPTVFNYFGSRDQLLLAIILKGHEAAVQEDENRPLRNADRLSDDICEMLTSFSRRSLEIFNKPVWRYADSTAIRHPESEFVKRYSEIDRVLKDTIKSSLLIERPKTRRGDDFDAEALAAIIYNTWNQNYIAYIKDDDMTLEMHLAKMLPQIRELLDLIFVDA